MLSGRYRLEKLTRHWQPVNPEGLCRLPDCWGSSAAHEGDISSFLNTCPSLSVLRASLLSSFIDRISSDKLATLNLCLQLDRTWFFLDCSTMPPVIDDLQRNGVETLMTFLKFTRNFCYCLHKKRYELLGTTY